MEKKKIGEKKVMFVVLDVDAPFPVSLVFSASVLAVYQKLFQFLFKLLRAETASTSVWWNNRTDATCRKMMLTGVYSDDFCVFKTFL